MNFLQTQLNNIGHRTVATQCKVTRQAVKIWHDKGHLPDTEFLPTTHPRHTRYANIIGRLGKCKKGELL